MEENRARELLAELGGVQQIQLQVTRDLQESLAELERIKELVYSQIDYEGDRD